MLKEFVPKRREESLLKNKESNLKNRESNVENKLGKTMMCRMCYAFFYKKSWHFEKPELPDGNPDEILVQFTQCTACLEQENAFYEVESALTLSN